MAMAMATDMDMDEPTPTADMERKKGVKVHRCRFIEHLPAAINALDFSASGLLACGRANGDIEIRDSTAEFAVTRVIPGGANRSVAGLCWVEDSRDGEEEEEEEEEDGRGTPPPSPPRLFSSGHNGQLTEWNLATLNPARSLDVGGAVWCLAASPSGRLLAAGCQDGVVRLFDVSSNTFEFFKSLDRADADADARLLSLAFSPDGAHLYAGTSTSSVLKYSLHSSRIIARTSLPKQKKEDTLVWSVKPINNANSTLVAATSLGNLHFIDVGTMTVSQSLRGIHAADILSLAVDAAGRTVFSAGVDRKIVQTRQTHDGSRWIWVVSGERRWHSHDVRALALNSRFLVSGGADTQLVACTGGEFPNVAQKRVSPFPGKSIVQLLPEQRILACRFPRSVKFWRLGGAEGPGPEGGGYRALLDLQLAPGRNLVASHVSPDGKYLAVSDPEETKLFRLDLDAVPARAKRVAVPSTFTRGAHAVAFAPDSRRLIVADCKGVVHVLDLEQGRTLGTFDRAQGKGVDLMSVSGDGSWLAVADGGGNIEAYNLDSLKHHTSLPTPPNPPTTLTFHPTSHSILLFTTTSNSIFLYDVEEKRFTDWTREHGGDLPARWVGGEKVVGVAFNPARERTVVYWGRETVVKVDLDKAAMPKDAILTQLKRKRMASTHAKLVAPLPEPAPASDKKVRAKHRHSAEKQQRREKLLKKIETKMGVQHGAEIPSDWARGQFSKMHRYQPLMFLGFAGGDEMVVVERPWFGILESLPPAFQKKTYGDR